MRIMRATLGKRQEALQNSGPEGHVLPVVRCHQLRASLSLVLLFPSSPCLSSSILDQRTSQNG